MVRQYETTFIVDAHLPTERIDETIEKFLSFIEKKGGKIHNVDRWGKRRLSYEIKKKQYGYYVYVRFESEGEFIRVLEREYRLDDAILRYLTVLVPKIALENEALRSKEKTEEIDSDEEEYSENDDEDEEDMRTSDSEQTAEDRKESDDAETESEDRSGKESEKEERAES
ncbi:MAG TPA: 30S ribosomal protein S6 [bacterium]|nr:30S ribosomal protein S6 [bacterium]